MAGVRWEKTPEQALDEAITAYREAVHQGIWGIAMQYAPLMENHMKSTAPWKDRSGNARQALNTQLDGRFTDIVTIDFGHGHGVDYGKYLEYANSGRYAVVMPTMDYFAPKIWAAVERLFAK